MRWLLALVLAVPLLIFPLFCMSELAGWTQFQHAVMFLYNPLATVSFALFGQWLGLLALLLPFILYCGVFLIVLWRMADARVLPARHVDRLRMVALGFVLVQPFAFWYTLYQAQQNYRADTRAAEARLLAAHPNFQTTVHSSSIDAAVIPSYRVFHQQVDAHGQLNRRYSYTVLIALGTRQGNGIYGDDRHTVATHQFKHYGTFILISYDNSEGRWTYYAYPENDSHLFSAPGELVQYEYVDTVASSVDDDGFSFIVHVPFEEENSSQIQTSTTSISVGERDGRTNKDNYASLFHETFTLNDQPIP